MKDVFPCSAMLKSLVITKSDEIPSKFPCEPYGV